MASKFTITAELNLQTKNLGQTVNNLKQQFKGMDVNIKVKDLAAAESSIRNISKEAKSASQSMGLLGSSIGMAFKRFAAVTLATGTIVGFTRAVKNAVGDAISFEREIVKIAQATGKTVAQLKTLANEVGNVATNFGVSSKELLSAARSLTQAGFAADKVTGALKLLAQTELAATFDSIGDTTEGVIALLNQFGRTAQRTGTEIDFLEKSLSAINQVSKEFAVESSDLITVIRTTGSAFESAGGSLDELLALFTSVRSTTRESAESIATGFRTIFTRVQRVDTINALRDLGIELQDTEGKFVGPMEAAKRLSVALSTIDPKDFRFNMVVEELGGFRQVSKVIPLIQQFAVTQKALNVAQGSSGSLAKDAQTAQQSLAVQIQKTREEFLRFVRDLTESSSFQNTAKFLLDVANAFIKVADTMKPLIPLIASFGALKIGQAFLPSIKGFLGTKKAQGGKIHAFASGGLVPGQGNGDTVPAMLTPGEFVIKKSSVKSLGVDNLARANKYANGGYVIRPDPGKFAGFFMQPEGVKDSSLVSAGQKVTNDTTREGLLNQVNKNKSKYKAGKLSKTETNLISSQAINDYQPSTDTLSKAISSNIVSKEDFKNYLTGQKKLEDLQKQIDSDVADNKLDKNAGGLLKAGLSKERAKYDKFVQSKIDSSTPQGLTEGSKGTEIKIAANEGDVPAFYIGEDDGPRSQAMRGAIAKKTKDGFSSILSGIGTDPAFKDIGLPPLDVKGDAIKNAIEPLFNSEDPKSARVTIEGYVLEGITSALTGIQLGGSDTTWDFPEVASSAEKLGKLFGQTSRIAQVKSGDAKRSNSDKAKNSILTKKIASTLLKHPDLIGNVKEFASGGLASGSDTVPAMLTPGEFVINKKSAESIGYSSLNKMNKVGKFANGGRVQYLSRGGEAGTKGIPNAPLVDDILQATGAILPNPKNAIAKIKEAGGASLDMDRTLLRTIGDLAYGKAKTPEEKLAVLKKYFFDDAARLRDVKSAKITQFGIALQGAVENKEIDPKTLSVISKSDRTPGLPEFLQKLFGIPPANMVFTGGKNKQPAVDMFRERGAFLASGGAVQKFAKGGEVQHLNIGGIAKDTNSEFNDIFSKYSDNDLNHAFIKTALLSPNFADSLTKYRELNLLSKSDNSKGNSLKTMMSAYGLSKLNDKQLNDKYKNKFEITDDIKNTFKYYDRGITDLVSTFKKEHKNKISEIANIDLKKDKNYGDIEVFTGKNAISAKYAGDENDRTGFITAVKKGDFYRTKLSYATSGYGLKLYETLLNEVTKAGSWLAPDNTISSAATNLWKGYYSRSDVDKKLLDYSDWNNKTGKFKTTPAKDIEQLKSTWPPKKDLDWALQHSYRKTSLDADDKNITRVKKKLDPSYEGKEAVKSAFTRFASGGNVPGEGNQDTVPAMLTPGEYVINKKSAQAIGYGALNGMNKVGKFAKGGPVKHFAAGGQATFDQGQQQMQKALFIPKIQALVSPGQLKTIEKIVDDYIKDNKDAEAVMKAIVRDLENQKKQTGQVKIGKPLIERAERAATRNNTLENKKATPPKDEEMPKLSERLKTLGDSTDNTATKFLIMAGVAESVVSQMSGLSDEVKNATSAFGATFATYMAIGNGLKDLTINISQSIAKRVEENAAKKAEQIAREAQNAAIKRNAAAFDAHSAKLNSKGGGGLDAGGKAAGGGKLAKGMAIFDGALMGFSVAMGIAAAATEYYATLARKAGKELDETVAKFKKDSTSVSQGELSNKFTKALTTSARADSISRNTQSTGGMAKVGATALGGAALGAYIGSIFPVVGTAIGAVVGGIVGALGGLAALFLKSNVEFNGAFENIQKSANNLSSSIYESVTATAKARKFLEKIDTKTTQDVFSELNSTTNSYVSSLDKAVAGEAAAIAAFGSIEKVPEQFKKSIDEVKQSAMELKQELDRIVGANTGKKIKELSDKIGTTQFDVVKDITSFVDSQQQNISKSTFSETKANYSGRFAELQAKGADTSGLDIKVMNLSVVKAAHAAEELKLSLLEASLQVVAQKEAILKEKAIRDKLIGSMIDQQAFEIAFANFKFSLDKVATEVDNIAAVYSGSVTGLKSMIPDASILDIKKPMGENTKDFDKALSVISQIGPAGQKLATNLSDLNKVVPKFEIALASTDFSKMLDPKDGKAAVDKFIGDLGVDLNSEVADAMRNSFAQASSPANMKQGDKLDATSQAKKILDSFKEMADVTSQRGKQVLEMYKASEAKAQAIQEAINQSRERQLELELSNADAYEALQKNIAQARGRSMSLAEGDQLRGNRQTILAGNLGGNAKAIGAELKNIRDQLKNGVGDRGELQNKSKKLTKALEELANQSGRTSEIMSKIDEAKAKRETARDFAKDFVFGTNEQRDAMQKDISNARTAAQQGNLSSVAEEDRAGVGAMFERFKDLPIFNGMTGRQAQNKVLANEVRAAGGGEQMARMIEQDTSSPEEKLIQELKNTAAREEAAREELFNKEEENINENNAALALNTKALNDFVTNLKNAKTEGEETKADMEKNQGKAPDAKALEQQRKALELEVASTKEKVKAFEGAIVQLTSALDAAVKQMYIDIKNRSVAAEGAVEGEEAGKKVTGQAKAKGGLVYLAKGGDVFKPQGTDTVPAMLTPGEFVIKKSSVDKIGSDKLNQLNQGGDIKAFAKGGLVSYLQMGGLASSNGNIIDKLSKRVTKLEKETKELKKENESLKTKVEEIEQVGGVRNQMQNVQNMTGNVATNQQQVANQVRTSGGGEQMAAMIEQGSGNRPMGGTRSQIRARQRAMKRQSDAVFKEEGFDQNNSNTTTTIDRRGTKDQVRARERALKRRDGKDIAEEMGLGPETAVKPVNTATQAPVSEYDKLHKELINPRTTAARSREIMARQSELEKLTAQEQDKQTQAMNDRVSASKAETSATLQHTLDASKYGDVPESPFTTAALNDIEKRYAEKSANVDKEISDVNAQGLAIGQKKMAEAMQFNERQVPQEKLYEQEEMMAQLESVGVNSNPAEYTYGAEVDKKMADLKAKYDAESAKALDADNGELASQLGKQYTKDRMALESQSEEGLSKVKGTGEGVDAEGNTIDTTYGVFDGHRMPAHEAQALMNKRVTSALIKKNQTPVDENGNPLEGNMVSRFLDRGLKANTEVYLKPVAEFAMRNSGIAAQFGVDRVSTQEEVDKRIDDEAKKPMTKAELADVRHGIRMDQLSRGQLGLAAASNTTAEQTLRETNALTPSSYKGAEGYGGYYENPPLSKTQTVSTPEEVDAQLKVHQDRYKAMGLHLGGVVSYLARGGSSRGSDTVPAMLTPGEFVMNKDSVSKYGTSFMEKLNKGGVVPGFANGGAVGQRNDAQTTAVQQSPVKTVVDSATPREQPAPKMMDDGLFARSVESLNTIASTFSSFTETLQGLVSQFAGITVKHTMTVDGNLAITGVDPATIGKTIADALMKSIGDETLKQIQTKQDQKQGPMR